MKTVKMQLLKHFIVLNSVKRELGNDSEALSLQVSNFTLNIDQSTVSESSIIYGKKVLVKGFSL